MKTTLAALARSTGHLKTVILTIASILVPSTCVLPAESVPPPKPETSPAADAKGARPTLPKFDEVTRDMKALEGLFTLYYYPPEVVRKAQEQNQVIEEEKLLCQVPARLLGKRFMLSTSVSGGGFFTGFPIDERVVQWELFNHQLLLIEPESHFLAKDNEPVNDVVQRTHPAHIRASVPVVTRKEADLIIELGNLLKSNFADIGWMASSGMGRPGEVRIDSGLSKWTTHKSFPFNVEIGVELALNRTAPPGSYEKRMVHYSFWQLPETGYKPRAADDRVGYFLTAQQDWSQSYEARDIFHRYIDRWQLEKRDPNLAICEPKQPIVFYIEKTVPIRFRRAVRDGILEWNKAFREIGFVGAIDVRQQTEDNEWKDLDPEDMRYSFFRWIVTGAGFAFGPHRANPFTGQIYNAEVCFDDSMVRFYEQDAQRHLPTSIAAHKLVDPAMRSFFDAHPEWGWPAREWQGISYGNQEAVRTREALERRAREQGLEYCDYADGMKHQLLVARAPLAGRPPEAVDRLLYDVVKEIVMHEVGHTLGLRHNFKASSIYSLEEIRKRRELKEATTGSVMDYNPILFFKDKALAGDFVSSTIGPYDYWAIEYGYRPAEQAKPASEETKSPQPSDKETPVKIKGKDISADVLDKLPDEVKQMIREHADQSVTAATGRVAHATWPEDKMLSEIAKRAAEPELVYGTDEDTSILSPDPRANRFDAGSDPIEWARTRIELIDQRLKDALDWAVEKDESWYHLRDTFLSLAEEKTMVLDYVGRYIGGQYINRAHRGDANAAAPFELVPVKRQREALAFIEENLCKDDFFVVSPQLLNHLPPARWYHQEAYVDYTIDFPIHEYISLMQWWNLSDRLFPNTIRRIYDAELKTTDQDRFTAAEYLRGIQKACWSEVLSQNRAASQQWTDHQPYLSSIRRSLQREYLGLAEPLVRSKPGSLLPPDLHAMLQHSLRQLAKAMDASVATGKLDFASEAHLVSCKSRIQRMLEPELYEQGPTGRMISL